MVRILMRNMGGNKMDKCKLNLGPFNDCVDLVQEGHTITYEVNEETATTCLKVLGLAIDNDTPENRKKLKRAMEFSVIRMIYELAESEGIDKVSLSHRIRVPIASVNFHVDREKRLCITAQLNVAIVGCDEKAYGEEIY